MAAAWASLEGGAAGAEHYSGQRIVFILDTTSELPNQ